MDMSAEGRAELRLFEGTRLAAYRDSVGVITIATGHTAAAGAPIPKMGMTITAAQADEILATDLAHIYEPSLDRALKVSVAQHEYDACCSLLYNIGGGNFDRSSVLAKLNAGDKQGAADAFLVWNRAGGRVLPGLTKRRETERSIFLTGSYPGVAPAHEDTTAGMQAQTAMHEGASGADVTLLQQDLAKLGYRIAADGDFGSKTVAVVKAFQRSVGLSDDGAVGLKTHAAIEAAIGRLAP